jgi:hypothetical protein
MPNGQDTRFHSGRLVNREYRAMTRGTLAQNQQDVTPIQQVQLPFLEKKAQEWLVGYTVNPVGLEQTSRTLDLLLSVIPLSALVIPLKVQKATEVDNGSWRRYS